MAEDIVVRYKAEVDEALKKLDSFAKENEQLASSSTKAAKGIDKTTAATDKLEKELQDTDKSVKKASKSIDDMGKKGASTLKGVGSSIKSFAVGAAAALGAAFSIQAIVAFGKASVDAFLEAEKNAERLKFAITTIGKESEASFERLIRQSERMQKITVFSDDSIQQAQAALSAFGLTADEIERTIPLLADYATITTQDIASAAQQIGAGLEGAGKEFKKYGIIVDTTASRQENLNSILGGFVQFSGAAEAATKTLSGEMLVLKNRADELEENVGSKMASAFIKAKIAFFEFMETILTSEDDLKKSSDERMELAEREAVISEIQGRAAINKLTILENAEKRIAEIEKEKIVIRRQMIAALQKDDKSEDARLIKKEQRNVRELKFLNEIIQIENDRIKAAKEAAKVAADEAAKAAAAKKAEDARKEYERLKKIIEDEEKNITEIELDEIAKRNKAFFDAIDERAERARQAGDIWESTTFDRMSNEPPEVRDKFAAEREKELIAAFEVEKALLKESSTDWEDTNNKIVIAKQKMIDEIIAMYAALGITFEETADKEKETWIGKNEEMLQLSVELFSSIAELYSTFAQREITEINTVRDAELDAIDAKLKANEEALKLRRISSNKAALNEQKLLKEKEKAEQKADAATRRVKRQMAVADKAMAIAKIVTNTAVNVSTAGGNPYLIALYIALGAAQAAIVAAQPIPYKKGTKRSKGGMALVGEEGPELTWMPHGSKVLPTKQTNRYGEVIDAMYDGKLDEYIKAKYMAPVLQKEKAKREVSFAQNIARSAGLNPETGVPGLTYYDMEALRKKGTRLTDDTIERLADAMSKRSTNYDPYRR